MPILRRLPFGSGFYRKMGTFFMSKITDEERKERFRISRAKYRASEKYRITEAKRRERHYRENKESIKAKRKEYYYKNQSAQVAAVRAWQMSHSEEHKSYNAAYRKAHPEYFLIKAKEYAKKKPEKLAAQRRAYYLKNTKKIKAQRNACGKRYRKKYPERAMERHRRRRAIKLKAPVSDSKVIEFWVAAWKKKKRVRCYWCELLFPPKSCHVDHIIALELNGHHSIENLCISCASCNCRKNDRPVSKWNLHLNQPVLL